MQTVATRPATHALPPHIAAACIFARSSQKTESPPPPPSGVLAELAALLRSR